MVDCKPTNMNELNEVITSAEFSPTDSHSFIHATSKGVVKLTDMRQQAICDKSMKSKNFIIFFILFLLIFFVAFSDKKEKKSFFSEVIGSISDVKFSPDGRYILARDYLKLKIWDVNMDCT